MSHGVDSVWRAGRADDGSIVAIVMTPPATARVALDEIRQRWPPRGLTPCDPDASVAPDLCIEIDAPDTDLMVRVDGVILPGGWDLVESRLGLFATEHLVERVAVHAAVIVTAAGAIVLPGVSYSGKSTLARAAHRRGLLVLSDEYALVDPDTGTVQGWPRPLRERSATGIDRTPLGPADHAAASVDHVVRLVAALQYGAAPADMGLRSRTDTVLAVLANTVCGARRPEPSFRAALALTRSAVLVGGTRGDSDAALDELLALADSHR